MGRLIYGMNVSLDGFVETTDHSLEHFTVDEDVHSWFNDQARRLDASIYGRRMYQLMADYWPTAEDDPAAPAAVVEFARIWKPLPKVVFSTTLTTVEWNSRLVRGDVAERLAAIREEFDGDLDVGGPTLAHEFIRRDLVDEYQLVVHPVVLGAGTPYFPRLEGPLRLKLTESRQFDSGVVYLGYSAR